MDVFKLLTRSTSLQKSASTLKNPDQAQIPSAGFNSRRTTVAHGFEDFLPKAQSNPRGVKRKRSPEDESQSSASSDYLDFFGKPDKATPSTTPYSKAGAAVAPQETQHRQQIKRHVASESLGEDECRKILKRNKLKVTVLKAETGPQTQSKLMDQENRDAHQKMTSSGHLQISPRPLLSFKQLRTDCGISRRLAENLDTQGYFHPTEVQLGSLPLLLGSDEDRGLLSRSSKEKESPQRAHVDLLTIAPTGSGKTLAFMINALHGLIEERRSKNKSSAGPHSGHELKALIVAPTHELADQIVNEGRKLALGTGIRLSAMRKDLRLPYDTVNAEHADSNDSGHEARGSGTSSVGERSFVKADVLVSTPLTLLNALSEGPNSSTRSLPGVQYLVLDEADVLLDPLFRAQTLGIWSACTSPKLQTSLWSATIGSSIESLAQSMIFDRRRSLQLSNPHHLIRVIVGLKDSAIPNISHRLTYAATEQGKLLALRQLLHPTAPSNEKGPSLQPPFLIFTQTIQRAIALHSELLYDIPPEAGGSSRIAVLHSDLSDAARSAVMAAFRKGEIWVLITTDLLSRGIDFRGMNGVVNYDIPNTRASYVHRAGRTGRQGREGGIVVTLYTKEDIPYVKNIANVIAASEKANQGLGEGVQKWLLDALPNVSKKMKKELKRKGVQSRRNFAGKEGGKDARRARISTKSGYDRRLQNKRKGAAISGARRRGAEGVHVEADDGGGEWSGFGD
ncbi:MAG: hypothetical protein Q9191_000103 [Dirinaria sp. TL-2023a]